MIHPNMATLLGILAIDALILASILFLLLTHVVNRSFNCISIDGDTFINDTIALLANEAVGGPPIASLSSFDGLALLNTFTIFAQELSQLLVRDGEGAIKVVRVRVVNSFSFFDAKRIAVIIARSSIKTPIGAVFYALSGTLQISARTP